MSVIRILTEEVANRIAAGEVIERPASVVKELVENALDAEATRVDVAIREGGIRWICVTDDGTGLAREDAELAFRRHATSKIASEEDLARVGTLGFRGEALPSILSVARVRMRTRRAGDPVGVEVFGEGGRVESAREIGCPEGTRVEVAELFGQVPARRKFLKSPFTEAAQILHWIERIALTRPDVHFALERDGRVVLQLPATRDLRERVIAVVPSSFGERLLPLEGETRGMAARGFASPCDLTRGSVGDVYLFVNGRPVRDRLLLQAVRDAYRGALPSGRHPVVVLFLQVEPEEVDVNVHPAKWEVRFRDGGAVYRLVRSAVASVAGAPAALYAPTTRTYGERVGEGRVSPPPDLLLEPGALDPRASPLWTRRAPGAAPSATEGSGERPPISRPPMLFSALRFVGAALGTFLVFERPGGLVLIDQHAAHERVLYERLREAWFGGKVERQALLFPTWVELPRSAAEALWQRAAELALAGFEIETGEAGLRGGVRVGLRSVPAVLASRPPAKGWGTLLEETASALRDPEPSEAPEGLEVGVHIALATGACHAAFRKGDLLEEREVRALLEALDRSAWFPTCPHGRPILAQIDEQEIARRFLRG
jgi:DNA mismatch repair protein MutL